MKSLCLLAILSVSSFSAQAALTIDQWQTPKGAKVLYAYAPELPMVDVRMVFDAGSARDGDKKGVAHLTSELIGMGDAQRDEEVFAAESEALGVSFSTQSLKDMAVVSLRSLTRPEILTPTLAMIRTAISQPSFSDAVLAREKGNLLTALLAKQQSAGALASDRFWQRLYGSHPYATPAEGREDTVKAMTSADLKAFYQRYYLANNATVAIVGAVTKAQAQAIAEQLADALPVGDKVAALPNVTAPPAGLESIEFASTQTQILLGQLSVTRQDKDYVALYLANHILGGSGFASRLMEEVREKRGLVYGVGSSLLPMHQTGPWFVSLKTANANTSEALKVVQETVMGLLKDIPQAELDEHKDNIIGGFALETDSNKDIVAYLAMMGFYDLPNDWLATFPDKVRAIDRDTLMKVVQAHLKPERWTGVVLGKPSKTDAPVQTLTAPVAGGRH
jgi:zinc protease